jgi:uncharacterized protein YbjQ (UPF0145 family)
MTVDLNPIPTAGNARTIMHSSESNPYRAGRIERGTVPHEMVTTAFELDGYQIVKSLGVVRGITVRSRSVIGNFGAALQTLVGGKISILTTLCERTREESFDLMIEHAAQLGANAIIGARYDATEVMQGVTEVLSYGTAVYVEPARG